MYNYSTKAVMSSNTANTYSRKSNEREINIPGTKYPEPFVILVDIPYL